MIDLSLLEPMFSVLGPEAAIYQVTGTVKERVGSASNTSSPRNVYRCADGKYVALSASTQTMAKRLFETIGRADMIDDPRFRTNTDRVKHRALVDEAVGAWFATKTRDEALAAHARRGRHGRAGLRHRRRDGRSAFPRAARSSSMSRTPSSAALPMHNILPRLSATPGVWRRPAPQLGEHTDDDPGRSGPRPRRHCAAAQGRSRRVIRSLLYVPAHSERFVAKAHERGADAIILDLEDAVAPSEKTQARAALAAAVPSVGAQRRARVRAHQRRLDDADAEAACRAGAYGLFVPKARDPDALIRLAARLWATSSARSAGRRCSSCR